MIVEGVKITSLLPKFDDPELQALIPKKISSSRCEFVVSPVSSAFASAIRRSIAGELPVLHMEVDYTDIQTNDKFIIPEMLQARLRMIPILQSTKRASTLSLYAENRTAVVRDVKSSEFKIDGEKELPMNGTFTFCALQPATSIKISNIRLVEHHAYEPGYGMCALGVNVVSLAVDQKPIDAYDPTSDGISSAVANPRKWRICFITNGTIDPRDLVRLACSSLEERINAVADSLAEIASSGDEHVLTLLGESHTIGNLIAKTIDDLYPHIRAVVYACSSQYGSDRQCTITVRCDEDIIGVYMATLKHITGQLASLSKSI